MQALAEPILVASVSVSPYESSLVDSVCCIIQVSSILSDSYKLSFPSSMGFTKSQGEDPIQPIFFFIMSGCQTPHPSTPTCLPTWLQISRCHLFFFVNTEYIIFHFVNDNLDFIGMAKTSLFPPQLQVFKACLKGLKIVTLM